MWFDLKLSKAQICKITQSEGFAGSLMKVAVPLAKNNLAPLGSTAAAPTIQKEFKRKYLV